jgi:hypothetical protein
MQVRSDRPSSAITPRRTRLLRVPNLRAFQRAIARSSVRPTSSPPRHATVIVATTAAAAELRATPRICSFGDSGQAGPRREAVALPDVQTRDGWHRQMHDRLPSAPQALSRLEREVLARAAAREAIDAGLVPPFRLRPGLLSQILDLYDDLHRCRRTADAFERLLVQELEPRADGDRGAARLLARRASWWHFRAYERRRLNRAA